MKNARPLCLICSSLKPALLAWLWAALFLSVSTKSQAYTNTFDTPDALNGWVHWWGAATTTLQFDPSTDVDGNVNSGSMRVGVTFSRSHGTNNQFSIWGSFSGSPNSWNQPLDGTSYSHLEMDILWDPFSPTIPASGNFSSDFHYGFTVGDPIRGQIDFTNHLIITPSDIQNWIHLSMPLDPQQIGPNLTNIVGVWIKMWTGDNPTNSVDDGEVAFWVDNIRLRAVPVTPDYTNTFDAASSLSGWAHWWGGITETREFDPNMDADGNPNSGSMKVSVPYNRANADNQFSMWGSFSGTPESWRAPINGTLYTNLEMDIFWDPNSATRPATGDYGNDFRYGFAVGDPNYTQIQFNNHTVIAPSDVGHWFHLSHPIDLGSISAQITNIVGVWIKMWTGNNPTQSLSGTTIFWVDNIRLRAKAPNAPPPPPPRLEIERATPPGLRLFGSAPGIEHQRQNIRTVNTNYSWVGAVDPVTYAVTINAYPRVTNFQTHIFLVPGTSIPASQPDPDYGQPHCAFLDIRGNADGTAYAVFRYKTNEPGGNNFLYGAGSIATVNSSAILGTWNLTFNPNGNISMTSPSGANTNFTMPPEAVSFFNGPLYAYFGIQPNLPANIGLSATLARIRVTGVPTPIDESFSSATLNSNLWEISAQQPAGIVPVPPDALAWLNWTLPDAGFTLQTTSRFPPEWSDLTLSSPQIGSRKRVLILPSSLPVSDTGNYFFRMRKP